MAIAKLRIPHSAFRTPHLVFPSAAFLAGQDFQAGGPPAGLDRFDEFLGQIFLAHLLG